VRKGIYSYIVHDPDSPNDPFPVLAMTIDNDSNWLALLSGINRVFLWNLPERRWGTVVEAEINGRPPLAFFFGYDKLDLINPLLIVRSNGQMTEVHVESETSESKDLAICRSNLASVQKHFEKVGANGEVTPKIITASRRGCVHVVTQSDEGWLSEELMLSNTSLGHDALAVLSLPIISSFLVLRHEAVDLVDVNKHKVVHTFKTNRVKKDSLRCFHSTRRRPQCGNVGLASLALAYTDEVTGHCVLQTYFPAREGDTLCFREPWAPGSKTCCLWDDAVEYRHIIENPGTWESLQVGYLVGLRKVAPSPPKKTQQGYRTASPLRRRVLTSHFAPSTSTEEVDDQWEVWCISARGERLSYPLYDNNEVQEHLLINNLGPMVKVGRRSVAIGIGNIIKVITIGNERFDGKDDSEDDTAFVGMKASQVRRKKFSSVRKRL
jgi:hypothetical protein